MTLCFCQRREPLLRPFPSLEGVAERQNLGTGSPNMWMSATPDSGPVAPTLGNCTIILTSAAMLPAAATESLEFDRSLGRCTNRGFRLRVLTLKSRSPHYPQCPSTAHPDRKSTRLNSSHLG